MSSITCLVPLDIALYFFFTYLEQTSGIVKNTDVCLQDPFISRARRLGPWCEPDPVSDTAHMSRVGAMSSRVPGGVQGLQCEQY
jgi:hypothetical protein